MINIKIIDNLQSNLFDALIQETLQATEIFFAVAFMKYSGFRLIEPALERLLLNGGYAEFVIGLDFRTTDVISLRKLKAKANAYPNHCKLYCYSDPLDHTNSYHPKLYLLRNIEKTVVILGSSNLTQGGLIDNMEVNVLLQTNKEADEAEHLIGIYQNIKYQPTCFIPDEDYLNAYEEASRKIESNDTANYSELESALNKIRIKEISLPSPIIPPSNLDGWLRLVFGCLPDKEFTTNDIYAFTSEFKKTFPNNYNVEAKIRQTLQQLRDLGLIRHLGTGRWVKR